MRSIEQNFEYRDKVLDFAKELYIKILQQNLNDDFLPKFNRKERLALIKDCVENAQEFYEESEKTLDI